MRVSPWYAFSAVLVGAAAFGAACGRPGERGPPVAPVEVAARDAGIRQLGDAARSNLIHHVRFGPCGPGGEGYARWIEERLVGAEGTLLFADWAARPANEEIDEVRFTYTMLDASYRVMAGAYVWEVGQSDGEVRTPRQVEPRVRSGESEGPGSGDSGK